MPFPDAPVTADGEPVDLVEIYSATWEAFAQTTMQQRRTSVGKARGTFARLKRLWKLKQYILRKKLRLGLLYGLDYWRVMKGVMIRISALRNGCLKRIFRVEISLNRSIFSLTESLLFLPFLVFFAFMSRIERKYCSIRTSYLAGVFGISILLHI